MTRMTREDRETNVLESAITVAKLHGFSAFRLAHVAAAAQCSNATVIGYYSTMPQLRRAVMRAAIKRRLLLIIAQGIAIGDPTAMKVTPDLWREAVASLAK